MIKDIFQQHELIWAALKIAPAQDGGYIPEAETRQLASELAHWLLLGGRRSRAPPQRRSIHPSTQPMLAVHVLCAPFSKEEGRKTQAI